mgnify:CR=1 FL=1
MKNKNKFEMWQTARNHKNKVRKIAMLIYNRVEEMPDGTWAEANHIGHIQAEINRAYEVLKQYTEVGYTNEGET